MIRRWWARLTHLCPAPPTCAGRPGPWSCDCGRTYDLVEWGWQIRADDRMFRYGRVADPSPAPPPQSRPVP